MRSNRRRSETQPPSSRQPCRTPPPPPPPPPPNRPPVKMAGAPLASLIVGVCPLSALTDCVFEVCGVGALQGVGLSFRWGLGGGRARGA